MNNAVITLPESLKLVQPAVNVPPTHKSEAPAFLIENDTEKDAIIVFANAEGNVAAFPVPAGETFPIDAVLAARFVDLCHDVGTYNISWTLISDGFNVIRQNMFNADRDFVA